MLQQAATAAAAAGGAGRKAAGCSSHLACVHCCMQGMPWLHSGAARPLLWQQMLGDKGLSKQQPPDLFQLLCAGRAMAAQWRSKLPLLRRTMPTAEDEKPSLVVAAAAELIKSLLVQSEAAGGSMSLFACLCSRCWSSLATWFSVSTCKVATGASCDGRWEQVLHVY